MIKEIYEHPRFDMLHNAFLVTIILIPGSAINFAKQLSKYPVSEKMLRFWQDENTSNQLVKYS